VVTFPPFFLAGLAFGLYAGIAYVIRVMSDVVSPSLGGTL
jgi:hypothetical protein